MLRKKCKKTCLHASLQLVLARLVTKTLPTTSKRVARMPVSRPTTRARARRAMPLRRPRAPQLLHTVARSDDKPRSVRATTMNSAAACPRTFRKAAWTKALRAMHQGASGARRAVRRHASTRARREHRRALCMLYTLDPARTCSAALDARRHRRRSLCDIITERARE